VHLRDAVEIDQAVGLFDAPADVDQHVAAPRQITAIVAMREGFDRSLDGGGGKVVITTPSGEHLEVTLEDRGDGRAGAAVTVTDPGLYRLSDGTRTAIAVVGDVNPPEFADLRATTAVLEPLVRASGGAFAWLADGALPDVRMVKPGRDSAGRGWIGLRANNDYRITGIRQAPLMAEWLVLLLALGGLTLAWRGEGR
jgi:hypothetical protein